jgi:hypothetical protein
MKPCDRCGTALPNGAKQCEQCGAEQKTMTVKPFSPEDLPPPEPAPKSEEFFSFFLLQAGILAIPVFLGFIGHYFFGKDGAIIGVMIGASPWFIARLS